MQARQVRSPLRAVLLHFYNTLCAQNAMITGPIVETLYALPGHALTGPMFTPY